MPDKDDVPPTTTPNAQRQHNHAPAFRAQDHLRHTQGKRKAEMDRHTPVNGKSGKR